MVICGAPALRRVSVAVIVSLVLSASIRGADARSTRLTIFSSFTLGFPSTRQQQPSLFLSLSIDRPIATTGTEGVCHGCSMTLEDFEPGLRLGGVIGIAATMD